MKKIIVALSFLSICASGAFAEDAATSTATPTIPENKTPIASTNYVAGAVEHVKEYTDSKYGKIPTSETGTGTALIWVE